MGGTRGPTLLTATPGQQPRPCCKQLAGAGSQSGKLQVVLEKHLKFKISFYSHVNKCLARMNARHRGSVAFSYQLQDAKNNFTECFQRLQFFSR